MFEFHKDKARYFDYQYLTSKEYLIPFIEKDKKLDPESKILEIGCGEAGVLKAFYERGMHCKGIELSPSRIKHAKAFFEKLPKTGKIDFLVKNIFDIDTDKDLSYKFDIIILKDVIEHLPQKDKFLIHLKHFLAPGGMIFFGFPPWQMPYGGHQQITSHKLSKLPFIHLFPKAIYKVILKSTDQKEHTLTELLELKETGLSIGDFERLAKKHDYKIVRKKHFLINPIYQHKFGLKVREQWSLISAIPFIRNFLTSCAYYTIIPKSH